MPFRRGRYTISLPSRPVIAGWGAVVGKKEGEGPLGCEFSQIEQDGTLGQESWEKAESQMHKSAVEKALGEAQVSAADVDMQFAGDLLSQCTGTTFGMRDFGMPLLGLFGACSTMALSLGTAGLLLDAGAISTAVASTSSHFCSAEKQFRMPLEYGGQRTPTAQWTATAAGAAVLKSCGEGPRVEEVIIGRIQDLGVKDPNNMGAAMAPAACSTIIDYLRDTNTKPEDYDLILTGDLGSVGSQLLLELLQKQENTDISAVHADCGMMLYPMDDTDIHAGASGCGCSAAVVCSHILRRMAAGELKRVFFIGTGALLSAVSALQGESIPGIAHGVLLSAN